ETLLVSPTLITPGTSGARLSFPAVAVNAARLLARARANTPDRRAAAVTFELNCFIMLIFIFSFACTCEHFHLLSFGKNVTGKTNKYWEARNLRLGRAGGLMPNYRAPTLLDTLTSRSVDLLR